MLFSFNSIKTSSQLGVDNLLGKGRGLTRSISFELKASDDLDAFEIGDAHVLASAYKLNNFYKDRKAVQLTCAFFLSTSVCLEDEKFMNLSDRKIGHGVFIKEDDSDVFAASPPRLMFSIYVRDEEFAAIQDMLNAGRNCNELSIEFDTDSRDGSNKLCFGWEPDGSRSIWKFANEEGPFRLDVTSFQLSFAGADSDSVNLEVENVEDANNLKLVKELKELRFALYIVGVALLFSIVAQCTR